MRAIQWITFDLETLPGGDYPKPEELKAPAQYKKPESILAWQNDPKNLDAAYKKRALSYIEGKIFCIGFKIDDDPTDVVWDNDEANVIQGFEKKLVDAFYERFKTSTIHKCTLVGHNIRHFDLPYLWLRAMKYECKQLLKVIGIRPDDIDFEDTMMVVCVTDKYKGMASLDKACALFGLPGKGDVDGSMVYDMWKAGKYQKIADYCKEDVDKTYALAVKLGIIV
ncbi:MAG TPA: hypothetical protein ENH85_02315 [Candidatus Scalindua sp.]|nr:hypothetical protein [Candidatus Scalindua sp.]